MSSEATADVTATADPEHPLPVRQAVEQPADAPELDFEPSRDLNATAGECALEGCALPVPVVRRGRPPKYCSKAHADQASRDRRAADTAAVEEPLARAEAIARTVPAAIAALAEHLARLQEQLGQAQEGALSRVRRAEAESVAARQEAADAEARAQAATRGQEEAQTATLTAQRARQSAEDAATTAVTAAELARTEAAERVQTHRLLMEAAQAAQAVAEQARDAKSAELRQTQTKLEEESARARADAQTHAQRREELEGELASTRESLAAGREALATAQGDNRALHTRAEAAETAAATATATANTARKSATDLAYRLQAAESAATVAHGELATRAAELAAAHAQAGRLEAELIAARSEAAAQRERAARAEAILAAVTNTTPVNPATAAPDPGAALAGPQDGQPGGRA